MKITIVGVGALGSHMPPLLRNVGATIRVIDFDRVEQKNTQSQFHAKPTVGKNKTLALQQTVQFLWGLKIETVPHMLVEANATQLLGGSDLVIDCLDNPEARRVVQGFVRAHKIPCLHGALAADGGFGRVCWDESFVIDPVTGDGATCEDGAHLTFISITSSYLAHAAKEFLVSGKKFNYQVMPTGAIRV